MICTFFVFCFPCQNVICFYHIYHTCQERFISGAPLFFVYLVGVDGTLYIYKNGGGGLWKLEGVVDGVDLRYWFRQRVLFSRVRCLQYDKHAMQTILLFCFFRGGRGGSSWYDKAFVAFYEAVPLVPAPRVFSLTPTRVFFFF